MLSDTTNIPLLFTGTFSWFTSCDLLLSYWMLMDLLFSDLLLIDLLSSYF